MKKTILTLLIAYLTINSSFAIYDDIFSGIKTGTYKCGSSCVVELHRHGGRSITNCTDDKNTIAEMIKNNKCTYEKDKSQYYSCQYAQGSCSVTLSQSGHTISCMGDTPNTKAVLEDAKNGKCYIE